MNQPVNLEIFLVKTLSACFKIAMDLTLRVMNLGIANRQFSLIVILLLPSIVMGQEKIKPCQCIPCGGQIECQAGSTSWCECRYDRCFGGCLLPDRNPRRLAASVLTIITSEGNEISPDGLQNSPQRFAGILGDLLNSTAGNGTSRIEYGGRKIGFVFTPEALLQIGQVKSELETSLPSSSPTPQSSPSQVIPEGEISLLRLMKRFSWLGLFDLLILTLMSIRSLLIMVERYLTYTGAKKQSREFAPRVAEALKRDNITEAIKICDMYRKSHLAMVVKSALQEFGVHDRSSEMSSHSLEHMKRAMERAVVIKSEEFKRGLSSLTNTGWTAPQVGLLGFIIGLFHAIQSAITGKAVFSVEAAGGILEGLLLLALGIALGLCVRSFGNYFTNKAAMFSVEMENTVSELEDYFERNRMQGAPASNLRAG